MKSTKGKNSRAKRPGRVEEITAAYETAIGESAAPNLREICLRYGLTRLDITRLTGYSPRAVENWASGKKTSAASMRTLRELRSLLQALEELMKPGSIGTWLRTPNKGFHGASPMQVVERGDTAQIWRMIYLVGSGQPE